MIVDYMIQISYKASQDLQLAARAHIHIRLRRGRQPFRAGVKQLAELSNVPPCCLNWRIMQYLQHDGAISYHAC